MNKQVILFRNKEFQVSIQEQIKNILICDNLLTNEEMIIPVNELQTIATVQNNIWLSNNKVFTINNSIIQGIFSRNEIESFPELITDSIAWITISDPDKNNISIKAKNKLSLKFSDIEEAIEKEILFNELIAMEIINFITLHKDKKFIINCEAGISRSAAVGLFIEKILLKEMNINKHIRFEPNMFVFNLLERTFLSN